MHPEETFGTMNSDIQHNDNLRCLYRVVTYHSEGVTREHFFKSRAKAIRAMEDLSDQGVPVTLRSVLDASKMCVTANESRIG